MPKSWKTDSTGVINALLQEIFSSYNLLMIALFSAISGMAILTAHG